MGNTETTPFTVISLLFFLFVLETLEIQNYEKDPSTWKILVLTIETLFLFTPDYKLRKAI